MNNFIDEKTKELYTFLGAQARLQQIDRERADILRAFPQLDGDGTAPKKVHSAATIRKLKQIGKAKWQDPTFIRKQKKARKNRTKLNGQATP
jgi:hypothetical protein